MPLPLAPLFHRAHGLPNMGNTVGPHPWVCGSPESGQPRNHHPPQRPGGGGGAGQGRGRLRCGRRGQDSGIWEGARWSHSVWRGEGFPAPRAACPDHSSNRSQGCFVSLWGFPLNSQKCAKNAGQRSSGTSPGPGKALQREQQVWTSHQGCSWEQQGQRVRETLLGKSQVFTWGRMGLFDGWAWKPSSPCWFPQYPWFSLSPHWEAILQGGWGRGTTKGLAKARIPYNCFYKSSPFFPPASYLGPLGGESVTEPSWPCMLTHPAR